MLPKPEYGVFGKKKKQNIILLKQCEKLLKNMGFSNKIRNNLKSTLLTFFDVTPICVHCFCVHDLVSFNSIRHASPGT
jgi:hypothetical protein